MILAAPPPAVSYLAPLEVTMLGEYAGDPYDPEQNAIEARFTPDRSGTVTTRTAWYDGQGQWRVGFVPPAPGAYRVEWFRNGKSLGVIDSVRASDATFAPVRATPGQNRLTRDGKPVWPIGMNLAWATGKVPSLPDAIRKMGERGLDWARVWGSHWDGKSAMWTPSRGASLDEAALAKWDAIMKAASEAKVGVQMCFFHHGPVSTTVNPNWKEHPWNKANGGFLESPVEWFTNPEALRRQKIWLRYAVSRWATSPGLFAWELYNEVEWADAVKQAPEAVAKWHRDMAEFIRSQDPVGHPVVSSSAHELEDRIFAFLDMRQPHVYAADTQAGVMNAKGRHPMFVGEFGASGGETLGDRKDLRAGLIGSVLANHAGAAQWWEWDRVEEIGGGEELAWWAKKLKEIEFASHGAATRITPTYAPGLSGPLVLRPGVGWGPQAATVDVEGSGRVSSFIQGAANRKLGDTVRLNVTVPIDTTATLHIAEVSAAGGGVTMTSGAQTVTKTFKGEGKNRDVTEKVVLPLKKGATTLTIQGAGPDWVRFSRLELAGLGRDWRIDVVRDGAWILLIAQGVKARKMSVGDLGLPDGVRRIKVYPFGQAAREGSALIVKGKAEFDLPEGGGLILIRP